MDYSKYHFNYFDVIKRHERIINRPKDWEIKVLACIMLFVTFCYVFTSGVFASETEDVTINTVPNITISSNSNVFTSSDVYSTGYIPLEKGYIYYINYVSTGSPRQLAVSNSVPALNETYSYLGVLNAGNTFTYRADNNSYLYFSFSGASGIEVTRESIGGQSSAIKDLVDNVGTNQIWNVFENGISFVGVVVLVAFGLFLVVLAIKKISKGKSDY